MFLHGSFFRNLAIAKHKERYVGLFLESASYATTNNASKAKKKVYHADVAKNHPRGNHSMLALIFKIIQTGRVRLREKSVKSQGLETPKQLSGNLVFRFKFPKLT